MLTNQFPIVLTGIVANFRFRYQSLLWPRHPLTFTRSINGREYSLAEMFCVKCKEKKTVPDDQTTLEKTAKGRNMLRATCPTCGTKMTKFTK
jgi:hypothetical protein